MTRPVLVWGTCDLGKPRTRLMLAALKEAGHPVETCHIHLWRGVEDKTRIRSPLAKLGFLLRALWIYPLLLWRYLWAPKHKAVLIGYPGPWEVLLLRPLAWLRGAPIVWDVFISLHDTVVRDRALMRPGHPAARLLYALEWCAARLADRVVLDTRTHLRAFLKWYGLPEEKGGHVFVGAEAEVFQPLSLKPLGETMRVLFYGQYIPLHGIQTIVEAAAKAGPDVSWVLIGSGQEEERIRAWLEEHPAENLTRLSWVPYEELRNHMRDADILLGIFGTSEKAGNVIPNKAFQALACGKPLLTRDSSAVRELVSPDDPGVYLVPPGDADALCAALERFRRDRPELREPLHEKIQATFSLKTLGAAWLDIIENSSRNRTRRH
ncbi:MAG: glycosyltransferase [Acidobacteriota bacterium]|nr:glycosyltransferase [Acidobacteriota bacterium]